VSLFDFFQVSVAIFAANPKIMLSSILRLLALILHEVLFEVFINWLSDTQNWQQYALDNK
jgi:hypothetical protein